MMATDGSALHLIQQQRRFLDATVLRRRPEPAWHTPHKILARDPAFLLRDFSRPGAVGRSRRFRDGRRLPVLVVPPEVNSSHIVDFGPGQSLVAAALAAGYPRVAAIDWRSAVAGVGGTGGRDIDDSLASILDCIDILGGRVHLIGLCQGGWESALVAACRPEVTASLTLVAAPIDFHAGDGALRHVVDAMPMAAYQSFVAAGGGVMRGEFIASGFDNLLPLERHGLKWLRVWRHLDDGRWMERFHQLEDWYRTPKDLPGPAYLRAVRDLFKDNRLVRGRFVALGQRVELDRIRCPLALVMGTRDHITPPAQTRALRDHVGSSAILETDIPAGHVGTFMGREALAEYWPGVFDWLRSA